MRASSPPAGAVVDPKKRPFVIVHPRAAHGPGIGIGGFKADSEIGAPLSCRAGVERENPMRQTGGRSAAAG